MQQIITIIERLAISGRHRLWLWYVIVLVLIVTPAITIRILSYRQLEHDLYELTLARRESVAVSMAQALEVQLRRIQDYTLTLSTIPQVRVDIAAGQWEDAASLAHASLELTVGSFVERIFLTDANGVFQADAPKLAGVNGADFSQGPWHAGVVESATTFVTPVYKRRAQPQLNIIAMAAPVVDDQNNRVGIIVTQINLDTFAKWVKDIPLEGSGFAYVVDNVGQIVAHPKYSPQGPIMNLSTSRPVQEALRGRSGVTISSDPVEQVEQLTAYAPVGRYGWGLLIQESTMSAFDVQAGTQRKFVVMEGLVALWNLGVLLFLLTIIHHMTVHFLTERQLGPPPGRR